MKYQDFNTVLQSEDFKKRLTGLYGAHQLEMQASRYQKMFESFSTHYNSDADFDIFSASGRIEVSGNHTDHQLGQVLAMGVDLDTVAFARKNNDNVIRLYSEKYTIEDVDLSDLSIREDEYFTTMSLMRGVAAYFKELNGKVGGFDAYVTSNVLSGSGMSSSASIEVLIAKILDSYYGQNKLSVSDYAIISQKAENNYFNKPCGLMDQMVIAHGGFCAIDFYDKNNPKVVKSEVPAMLDTHAICLVNTGGNHADLSMDYAEIFQDCRLVSEFFGVEVLSRIKKDDFLKAFPELYQKLPTRAIQRAYHFFNENERVIKMHDSLEKEDLTAFLSLMIASGQSSHLYLQNVLNPHDDKQGLAMALLIAQDLLNDDGAWRVHGGGFAGTILCFVPHDKLDQLKINMEAVFGKGSLVEIQARNEGVCQVF